jgi:hypothetical protein
VFERCFRDDDRAALPFAEESCSSTRADGNGLFRGSHGWAAGLLDSDFISAASIWKIHLELIAIMRGFLGASGKFSEYPLRFRPMCWSCWWDHILSFPESRCTTFTMREVRRHESDDMSIAPLQHEAKGRSCFRRRAIMTGTDGEGKFDVIVGIATQLRISFAVHLILPTPVCLRRL